MEPSCAEANRAEFLVYRVNMPTKKPRPCGDLTNQNSAIAYDKTPW